MLLLMALAASSSVSGPVLHLVLLRVKLEAAGDGRGAELAEAGQRDVAAGAARLRQAP
jgi:hypothetical protein